MALTEEEQLKVRQKAMRLLEHMNRTEKGLEEKLKNAGFSPEAIKNGMDYVRSFGYLNDQRYAETYISSRIGCKSRQKLLLELLQKGIDRETFERAWEEIASIQKPDERQILKELIQKKYAPGTRLTEKEMRRLYGYLSRRGFRPGDIFSSLEELEIAQEKEPWDEK
ncbi:hypothetical protein EVA_04841 [gut metagenome]|uniref:Regulatory protein RecX n=1 Tax=gut metagenome TaxID=749906 RepID=J9GHS8_9ZZZZ